MLKHLSNRLVWLCLLNIALTAFAMLTSWTEAAWAHDGQSPERQTVPPRTATPAPATATPLPPPTAVPPTPTREKPGPEPPTPAPTTQVAVPVSAQATPTSSTAASAQVTSVANRTPSAGQPSSAPPPAVLPTSGHRVMVERGWLAIWLGIAGLSLLALRWRKSSP
jgi:hypothetical protein